MLFVVVYLLIALPSIHVAATMLALHQHTNALYSRTISEQTTITAHTQQTRSLRLGARTIKKPV